MKLLARNTPRYKSTAESVVTKTVHNLGLDSNIDDGISTLGTDGFMVREGLVFTMGPSSTSAAIGSSLFISSLDIVTFILCEDKAMLFL
jgi:hypothetical protein